MSAAAVPASMENAPCVSVIIPVFNDQAGVHACLEALTRQCWPRDHLEVVLIDNGSDPPLVVTGTFPFRLRVERCMTTGSYAARNAGTAVAVGEVLAFTDADCIPDPNWIGSGVRVLLNGSGAHVVGGDVQVIEPHLRTGTALYQYASGFQQRENIEQKGFTATANLFCFVHQFKQVGPFDERLLSCADREWAWRAARVGLRVVFHGDASVRTPPRATLRSAIRQARRVTAGRHHLLQHGLAPQDSDAIRSHRSALHALRWILTLSQFSQWERCRILTAALTIKIATMLERIRLRLGGTAERR